MSVKCLICKSYVDDEVYYGKFMKTEDIHVHYYCLLLCSNLIQNGEDDEGILGFLANDIRKEAKRISKRICCYCKKKSAAIGCCNSQCFRNFHLPCGIKNNCQSLFKGTYQSFCHRHIKVKSNDKHKSNEKCCICLENMGKYNPLTSICTPCCHNGFFHKSCIAKSALVAGYFFKCPLCNNNSGKFKSYMSSMGIFIPEQDAAWELEPNAYSELLERPNYCEADACLCSNGKKYSDNDWSFTYCWACGSKGIHEKCLQRVYKSIFLCKVCQTLNAKPLNTDTDTESELVNIVDLSSSSDEENIKSVRRSIIDEDSSEDEYAFSTRLKMIKPKKEKCESCSSDDAIAYEKSRRKSQPMKENEELDKTDPDVSKKHSDKNEVVKEDKYTPLLDLRSSSEGENITSVGRPSVDEDSSEDEYASSTRLKMIKPKKEKFESCSSDDVIAYGKSRRKSQPIKEDEELDKTDPDVSKKHSDKNEVVKEDKYTPLLDLRSSSEEKNIKRVRRSSIDEDSSEDEYAFSTRLKMIKPRKEKCESCSSDDVIAYGISRRKSQPIKEDEDLDKTVPDVSKNHSDKNEVAKKDKYTPLLDFRSSSDEEDIESVRSSSTDENSSEDEYTRITRSRIKMVTPKKQKSESCFPDGSIVHEKLSGKSQPIKDAESDKTVSDDSKKSKDKNKTENEDKHTSPLDLRSSSEEEDIESVRGSSPYEDSSEDECARITRSRSKIILPKKVKRENSESCSFYHRIVYEKLRKASLLIKEDEESNKTVSDVSKKGNDKNIKENERKDTSPLDLSSNSDEEDIESVRSQKVKKENSESCLFYHRIVYEKLRKAFLPMKEDKESNKTVSDVSKKGNDKNIKENERKDTSPLDLSSNSDEEDIESVRSSSTDENSSEDENTRITRSRIKMVTPKTEKRESCFPNGSIVQKKLSGKSQLIKDAESDKTVSDDSKKSNDKNIKKNERKDTSPLDLSSNSDEEDIESVRSSSTYEDSSEDEYARITRSRSKIILPKKVKIENSESCLFDHTIVYEKLRKASLLIKEDEESNKTVSDVCKNGDDDVFLIEENINLSNTGKSSCDVTFSLDQILTNRLTDGGNSTDSETHIKTLQRKPRSFSASTQNTISSNSDLTNSKVSNRAIPTSVRDDRRSASERSDISSVCFSSQDSKTFHEPDEKSCKEENKGRIMTIKETELTVPKVELIFAPILEPTQNEVLNIISSSTGKKRKFESEIILISSDSEKSPENKRRKIMKKCSERNTNIWKTGNKTKTNRRVPTKNLTPDKNCKNQSVITLYLSSSGSSNALSSPENSPIAIESVTKKFIPQFSNSPSRYNQSESKGSILHYFKKG